MSYTGSLPRTVGDQTIIECPKCGKKYHVTYHGKVIENDTYNNACDCGHTLFTETDRDCYSVKEVGRKKEGE